VGGRVIFLGTPQIKESIYNTLKDNYVVTKFPAVMPDLNIESEVEDVNDWVLQSGLETGAPTQPERFPTEVLLERQAKIGPRLFSLHYKLDTTLADAAKYPLKLSDLVVIDVHPEMAPEKVVWASATANRTIPSFGLAGDKIYDPMWIAPHFVPYTQTAMFVDPSGRGKDETSICIASTSNGFIYIHELLGLEGGYSNATLQQIAKLAYQYKIKLIRVESNFGDAMFCQLLRPIIGETCGQVAIEDFRVTGAKETRMINALEPVMAQHRLVFNAKAIKDKETQHQITRLTAQRGSLRHDDRVDALSAAVSFWEDTLGLNVDHAVAKNREKERQAEVDLWLSDNRVYGLLGNKASGAMRLHPSSPPQPQQTKWSVRNGRSWR
jgi:predicted phage terminase large subunit-like protein